MKKIAEYMRRVTRRPEGVKDVSALEQLFQELKPRYLVLASHFEQNPYSTPEDYVALEHLMKDTIPRNIAEIKGMIDLGDKSIFINITLDQIVQAEGMVVKYEKMLAYPPTLNPYL